MHELNRVLYIEDDPHIQKLVQMTLEEDGMKVILCQTWQEVIEEAREETPDLFLLDVMMPDKDGVETLRALRALDGMSKVPAVFLTVDADLSTTASADHLQPFAVIAKPFKVETIAAEIRATHAQML